MSKRKAPSSDSEPATATISTANKRVLILHPSIFNEERVDLNGGGWKEILMSNDQNITPTFEAERQPISHSRVIKLLIDAQICADADHCACWLKTKLDRCQAEQTVMQLYQTTDGWRAFDIAAHAFLFCKCFQDGDFGPHTPLKIIDKYWSSSLIPRPPMTLASFMVGSCRPLAMVLFTLSSADPRQFNWEGDTPARQICRQKFYGIGLLELILARSSDIVLNEKPTTRPASTLLGIAILNCFQFLGSDCNLQMQGLYKVGILLNAAYNDGSGLKLEGQDYETFIEQCVQNHATAGYFGAHKLGETIAFVLQRARARQEHHAQIRSLLTVHTQDILPKALVPICWGYTSSRPAPFQPFTPLIGD